MSKKILTTTQGGNGVLIRCSDGTEYEGDILVGADGAHSAIRQNLYKQLQKEKKLPSSDAIPLPFSTVCLVGQTKQLTPEEIPLLATDKCQLIRIVGEDKPYAVRNTMIEISLKDFSILFLYSNNPCAFPCYHFSGIPSQQPRVRCVGVSFSFSTKNPPNSMTLSATPNGDPRRLELCASRSEIFLSSLEETRN
jgi:hypothetical protein